MYRNGDLHDGSRLELLYETVRNAQTQATAEVVESTVSVVNSVAVVRENEVVVVNENVVGAAQSPGQMTVSVVERIGN